MDASLGERRETHGALDGFLPEHCQPFGGFDPRLARRVYGAVEALSHRLHIDYRGLDNIPQGRALLVGNHTFGFDSVFPMAEVWSTLHRRVWVLGEHLWWKVPFLRRLAAGLGTVDGTSENADELLHRGELLFVLPGGLREAVKPRELRYRLLWGHRYGFIRAAIRNQAPIVPVASIGTDDLFDLVGNAFHRGRRWLHVKLPIPLPSRILPIPHRTHLTFVFGEPIPPPAVPDAASEVEVAKRLRREVEGALHELIETELARRAGVEVD